MLQTSSWTPMSIWRNLLRLSNPDTIWRSFKSNMFKARLKHRRGLRTKELLSMTLEYRQISTKFLEQVCQTLMNCSNRQSYWSLPKVTTQMKFRMFNKKKNKSKTTKNVHRLTRLLNWLCLCLLLINKKRLLLFHWSLLTNFKRKIGNSSSKESMTSTSRLLWICLSN